MTASPLPAFPYGAVYFRKSNPPREQWSRDYATAAEDGHTLFRHWFLWSAIETEPGVYDWGDYDRQLDLAAEHGIKTIIAEMVTVAPEWAAVTYPHAHQVTRQGTHVPPAMHGSCAVGGAQGMCLDHADFREAAGAFLRALVTRYRDQPGLGGYDIWNECNYGTDVCYCPATVADFRVWLQARYGDLRTLGEAWLRYSMGSWDNVTPPRVLGPYPDSLDWLAFRIDNAYEALRWRAELIRSLDPVHPITAHGVAGTLVAMASNTRDDWRAAAEVDGYGYTWGSSRHGDEPWKQVHAVDLVRAASRGKPFWHAEAYAGPLWLQPNVVGKPRDEGRIATPADIRYWDMVSFMCGATGLLYLRWRPLLDGPLFGAFGPYGLDGARTERSEMASRVGKWVAAEEQVPLWRSRPVRGEVGLVVLPETQLYLYAQQGSGATYAQAMEGAFRGFYDLNVQPDWVRLEQIEAYDVLYLPIPVMMTQASAERLRAWVAAGGTLLAEGCPGYHGDRGHVGQAQPNLGFAELFGVRERYVEFTPDLLDDLRLSVALPPTADATMAWGGLALQSYTPTTGVPRGWYEGVPGAANGQVAVVENAFGKGRALIIGSMVGYGHGHHAQRLAGPGTAPCEPGGNPALFRALLMWAGREPHVLTSDPCVIARLHDGEGGAYLWVANPTSRDRPVSLALSERWGPFSGAATLWGAPAVVEGRAVRLVAPARDVTVLALR